MGNSILLFFSAAEHCAETMLRLRSADCNAGYVKMVRILRGVGPRTALRDVGYGVICGGMRAGSQPPRDMKESIGFE